MTGEILNDCFEPTLFPVLRLKPLFLLRDGIFSPLERALRRGLTTKAVATSRSVKDLELLLALHGLGNYAAAKPEATVRPAELIYRLGENITEDAKLLEPTYLQTTSAGIEGDPTQLYIHPTAKISPHAVLDTTNGVVVIDEHAKVAALSYVKGPAYIGRRTELDQCRFSNSIAGENCRLGGEIADSLIGNFSNKHHDGFLGHSIVGDWVNLGALTTTSDLKNNYGEVRLHYAGELYNSGTIKFGSIIGDFTKTAIGTLLGTGTIIDLGGNLFGGTHWSGYIPPFAWGMAGQYDRELFLRDAERMFKRRGQSLTPDLIKILHGL